MTERIATSTMVTSEDLLTLVWFIQLKILACKYWKSATMYEAIRGAHL
jgi:hypothetical protein